MTREEIRGVIVDLVEARAASWSAWPLLIEYDNRLVVDLKTQQDPYLCIDIAYISGEQVDLAGTDHRVYGQVHVMAAIREGGGTAKANQLLDFFVPALHMKASGGLRLWGSKPVSKQPHLNWVYYPVIIPFDADTLG